MNLLRLLQTKIRILEAKVMLRWLGHVLWMKDERLPKIVLFCQLSGATRIAGCSYLGWEDVINKDLKEMGTSWEGVKRFLFLLLLIE